MQPNYKKKFQCNLFTCTLKGLNVHCLHYSIVLSDVPLKVTCFNEYHHRLLTLMDAWCLECWQQKCEIYGTEIICYPQDFMFIRHSNCTSSGCDFSQVVYLSFRLSTYITQNPHNFVNKRYQTKRFFFNHFISLFALFIVCTLNALVIKTYTR